MFNSSSSSSDWMLSSPSEVDRFRTEANHQFVNKHKTSSDDSSFVSLSEEQQLLNYYYNVTLRDFCKSFQPPMPPSVHYTALVYFKRFYLKKSVMEFDPKSLLVTCVYLAAKVTEFNVTIKQFVENVKGDRQRAVQVILDHELVLMQVLDYRLRIWTPFKPLNALINDLVLWVKIESLNEKDSSSVNKSLTEKEVIDLRTTSNEFLEKTFMTDACLIFSPSQIALAVLSFAAAQSSLSSIVDSFVSQRLLPSGDGNHEKHEQLLNNMLESVWQMIPDSSQGIDRNKIKIIDKKIESLKKRLTLSGKKTDSSEGQHKEQVTEFKSSTSSDAVSKPKKPKQN